MSAMLAPQPLLPDEILAAARTVRDSYVHAAPHRALRSRYLAFYLSVSAVGCWVGAIFQLVGVVGAESGEFFKTMLTTLAVLTGFMITTLSFTGKAEAAKSLTLEQLREFARKSNHLLFSQLVTLATHLVGISVILLLLLLKDTYPVASSMLCTVTFGLFLASLLRSFLVPVQIIELHRFTHAALIEDKRQDADKAAESI